MLKRFRNIVNLVAIVMLLGAGFISPTMSYAQLPGTTTSDDPFSFDQNVNPYASNIPTGEEGEEGGPRSDTTKKDKKIRKPLESYFFNDSIRALDNFRWNTDLDYNKVKIMPLDTALTNYRIDHPYQKEGVGDMTLGGLGQSSQPINYFLRENYTDFLFAQSYDTYLFDPENVSFINSKNPFTQLTYAESGSKSYREVNFGISHYQNASPTTGFGIDYKSRGTKGLYDRQDTKNHNLALVFNHTGKRYSVHAAYINNHIEVEENGGVVAPWTVRDTTYEMNIGIPTKLSNSEARNEYRNNTLFVSQSYGIPLLPVTQRDFSISHLPAVYIGHSLEWSSWAKTYTDVRSSYTDERGEQDPETGEYSSTTSEYYQNWYIDGSATRDTLYESKLSNRLYVQAQPWDRNGIVGTVNGGIGLDMHTYSQFSLDDYLTGGLQVEKRTNFFAYGALEGKVKRYVDWGAEVKTYISGYRAGDLYASADMTLRAYIQDKPLVLSGKLSTEIRSPSYWQENLFSNHYVWFTPLNKENETRLEVNFEIPDYALEIAAWQSIVTNKIYYDTTSHVAQNNSDISLTGLYARKDFRFNGLHLDHRVLMQWSTDHEVVPVPLLSAYLSYYYEFWVKTDVLRLQAGVDTRYTSSYYMPGYNPALSTFYNQRDYELGGYPMMDIFVAGKWKRMRLFLKYQHANQGMFGNNESFSVANYPLNPAMFKFGISWGFYD